MQGSWTVIFVLWCIATVLRSISSPYNARRRVRRRGRRALRKTL